MKIQNKKVISIISIILLIAIIINLNPMRRSNKWIREYIFKTTQIGMKIDEVENIIISKDWNIYYIDNNNGVYINNEGEPSESYFEVPRIGNKSIKAVIGKYKTMLIIDTYVICYWAFDENSELIDIAIRKEYDVI
jgi:hypothetical protein